MAKSDLLEIPELDQPSLRILLEFRFHSQRDLVDQIPERLFEDLIEANRRVDHKTSKNYLYVLRMVVYYAKEDAIQQS